MKLAVSSLAWDPSDETSVVEILRRNRITGIELVPTKWRSDPYNAPAGDIQALRAHWRDAGFEIVALQSLLFGHPELLLFRDLSSRAALADYLRRAIDFAGQLGAHALVFGSPKNRWRGALTPADGTEIAADFFTGLAEYAQSRGCVICIEPNPPAYGADFITTTEEAVALCRRVGHPGFRVNLDLGAMAINAEAPAPTIAAATACIGHVHASAPNLVEVRDDPLHRAAAEALRSVGYDGWVSLEMRRAEAGGLPELNRSVTAISDIYS